MTESEEERRELLREFYRIYRPLQKRYNLRMHSHFDIYGNNFIEIWKYEGEKRAASVCKAREDNEVACYKRAIEELKSYGKRGEKKLYERAG